MTKKMKNILASAGMMGLALGIVVILGLAGARHTNAQEISTGYGLFCDTIEQVEYFIMLGDDENGLEETNKHFGTPKVCGLKVISFVEGDVEKVIKSPKGTTIHIIRIGVVGFYVGEQYKSITPSVQYSPFTDEKKKDDGASLPITLVRWTQEQIAQADPSVRAWYEQQEINPAAQKRLNVTFKSCCKNGDVFLTQFRVGPGEHGDDEWWYLQKGVWKRIPDDVIHWGEYAPDGQATLFLYASGGQELCFYPSRDVQ
jgi:hypothetical protein